MIDTKGVVLVSGHRGESRYGIENTMTAFRRALDFGVDMIETDVHMTKDGHLVLMHDDFLERTTDGEGLIKDLTLAEIRQYNATVNALIPTQPEPVPTMDEFLELMRGHPSVQLCVEFKDYTTAGNEEFAYKSADKIVDMLLAYGVGERTWIISFDGKIVEYVYKKCGKAFHYHGFYPWFIMGPMTVNPEDFIEVACMQHRFQRPDGEIVKYDDPLCPKEWFDYLLSKGIMPLMAPSLKAYPLYDIAFSWGSRIVNADDPENMLAHLKALGLH